MPEIIDVASQHKCAHSSCKCQVPNVQKYCSEYCSDASKVGDTEIQCDCKHASCALD